MAHGKALALVLGFLLAATSCTGDGSEGAVTEGDLVGTFSIAAGSCSDAEVTEGSYFRMVQPGGEVGSGPFVVNGDSPCGDRTFTPLSPGSDGGLTAGSYQSHPDPAFDEGGNALASAITEPQKWFAVAFALATNQIDPQAEAGVEAPRLQIEAGQLTGDLSSFGAAWNGQFFNQGAPKPDGTLPGGTKLPSGTYDPDTGRYSLDWASQIVGGAFNDFIGTWHLEGVFRAS